MNANVMILLAGCQDHRNRHFITQQNIRLSSWPEHTGEMDCGMDSRSSHWKKWKVLCIDNKLIVFYLHERFDETATVPRILVKVEPIETGQRDERHLRNIMQWMSVNLCIFCLTWDTCVIMLVSRESHSSWVRPEQGRLLSGFGIYIRQKQSCDKAVFCRVWNKQARGGTQCVSVTTALFMGLEYCVP